MRKSSLKSTTSLVVSFALVVSPLAAQQATIDVTDLSVCAGLADVPATEELQFPCVDVDGNLIADQDMLDATIAGVVPAAPAAEVPAEATPPVAVDAPEAEPAPVAETPVAPTEEVLTPEAAPAPAEEIAAEVAEPAVEEPIAAEPVAEEPVVEAPVTEEVVAAEPAVVESAPEEATAVATEQAPTDVAPVAEAEPEVNATPEPAIETVTQEEPPAASAAATAGDEVIAETEIAVEEVTAEDVRSSDQDFETRATGNATATADTTKSRDRGLSNFEKALLLGLGAAVVGSVLANGDEVKSNSGDRVVVERDGELVVLKDDDVLLRQPGTRVQTQTFDDGSTRTVVQRDDGTQIITVRASDGRVLRRARVLEDGTQVLLFDDTVGSQAVVVTELPRQTVAPTQMSQSDMAALRQALMVKRDVNYDRSFSLRQIRTISAVRMMAPEVELDTVTFASGSAAIDPSQAEELTSLGLAISNIVADDPSQVFLIEGHTDAVGDAAYNLALSDRRAESVALAMTEYFGVPPENLITQGYGESILKVQTPGDERANRRASVRNITPLLR